MPAFGRVLTAMVTPLRSDRSLDLDGAQRLARHLLDHGSEGLVIAGTTGESPTLSHDETLELFTAVVEAVGERAPVIAGCGKNDTAATVGLVREATEVGVDGVLLVTPYYNKPSQRGLIGHFTAAAEATDLPVLLYNIPSRSACEIAPATLLRLAEGLPNVIGVKDAVGNFAKTAWLTARAPEGFGVWAGDDATFVQTLAAGGVGVVSVAGHLVAEELATIADAFPHDPAKARTVYQRLLPLFDALFVDSNPVPLKAALAMRGLPGGPVRPPLAEADDATVETMRSALAAVGLSTIDDG
ncbi:MAG: 4-hydroxy-tetrahydrodipicolinate synthase [Egibacteraceae bacterium]